MILWPETEMFIHHKARIFYEERVMLDAMLVCAQKENISSTFFKCSD